jgi:putative CocE/NonD family hydrolase
MAAASGTDDITCQWIGLSSGNVYETVFQGGAFREALVTGWFTSVGYDYEYHMQMIEAHPDYDDFWKPANLGDPDVYSQVTMPALRLSGWYDAFSNGAIEGFTNIQHHGTGNAAGNQYLIMGPWIHGITSQIGELTFPESCKYPPATMNSGPWNDYWLKGIDNEVTTQPHVIYWAMGDLDDPRSGTDWNIWRTADDWPPPSASRPYYLTSNGGLSRQMLQNDASTSFNFDPDNPVPTLGGNNYIFVSTRGPYDQRPVESRSDVLLFTSDVLPRPLEIGGRMRARLYVSSDCVDTDFTAKLTDVYPDGRSMLIADGIIRTRYRESPSYQVFMNPGQVYEVEIDLWSTSYVFNTGHQIRVAISSSNHPRFDVNPNTGLPWDPDWETSQAPIVATNTIHTGPTYSSCLLLPVIEQIIGDCDGDGDVDLADFGYMQSCLTGPGVLVTDPDCQNARLDRDVDVDQDDMQLFVNCIAGPGVPVLPDCIN